MSDRRPIGKHMIANGNVVWSRSGGCLGQITWYPAWKCWVFVPNDMTIFSSDCLAAMASYLKSLSKPKDPAKEVTS